MEYFIIENGQQAGPFTMDQLAEKNITSETLVWKEGMTDWTPAWKVQELRTILEGNYNDNNSKVTTPPVPPTDAYQQGFQQGYQQATAAQQNWQSAPKKKSNGFLWKALLLCIFIILAIFTFTNPGKEAHKEAVKTEINRMIEKSSEAAGNDIFSQGIKMFTQMFAGDIVDTAIDQLFEYHNYVLFSKGTVEYKGKPHTVSIGFLGSVHTFNADDIMNAFEKGSNDIKITTPAYGEDNAVDSSSDDEDFQQKLEDKANEAVDKISDEAKQKVKEKIEEKVNEATDSSTIEKLIDKVMELF